jgi:hypothetical protein
LCQAGGDMVFLRLL